MFKNLDERLRPGGTPERVLAIARMIAKEDLTSNEIALRCTLGEKEKVNEGINYSIDIAEELNLVKNINGKYSFVGDPDVIKDYNSFRRYVSKCAFSRPNTTFFKATKWFMEVESRGFSIVNFDQLAAEMKKDGINVRDDNDTLGWRFWVRFLGLAYQLGTTLIPNAYVRLSDCLQQFESGTEISSEKFISWLKMEMPEVAEACTDVSVCLAVSNGLRTLDSLGKIKLISTRDAFHINLCSLPGVEMNRFSGVLVKEGLHDEMA